ILGIIGKCIQTLTLCLVPMSNLARLIQSDMTLFLRCDQHLNLAQFAMWLETGCFMAKMFQPNTGQLPSILLVKGVLIDHDYSFFLHKQTRHQGKKIRVAKLIAKYTELYLVVAKYFVMIGGKKS